jgi:hypothetical protein
MNTVRQKERQEQFLYLLVTCAVTEQLRLLGELKEGQQAIYGLVLQEFNRVAASLERRQNRERRKRLVGVFTSLVGIKTLLEEHYPHLRG